jgi:hypothetical protein
MIPLLLIGFLVGGLIGLVAAWPAKRPVDKVCRDHGLNGCKLCGRSASQPSEFENHGCE